MRPTATPTIHEREIIDTTNDGFRERLLTLLSEAAKISEERIDQARQDWLVQYNEGRDEWIKKCLDGHIVNPLDVELVDPFHLACPICQKPMNMTGASLLCCTPCSAYLYRHKDDIDRRPVFLLLVRSVTTPLFEKNITASPGPRGDPNSLDYFDDAWLDDDGLLVDYGEYTTIRREILWNAESTEFGVLTCGVHQGECFDEYTVLDRVPKIMSPEQAKSRLQTLIVFG